MSVVAYYRYSPRPDTKKGQDSPEPMSIEVQRTIVEKYCEANDLQIEYEFEDPAVSARLTRLNAREGGRGLIGLKGKTDIVVHSLSRLFRDLEDGVHWIMRWFKSGVTLHIASQGLKVDVSTPENWLAVMTQLNFMCYEPMVIAARTKAAAHWRMKNGMVAGGKPPFGFKRDPMDDMKLIEDEREQEVIKRARSMMDEGVPHYKVRDKLRGEGRNGSSLSMRLLATIARGDR